MLWFKDVEVQVDFLHFVVLHDSLHEGDGCFVSRCALEVLDPHQAFAADVPARVKLIDVHFIQPTAVSRDATGFLRLLHRAQGQGDVADRLQVARMPTPTLRMSLTGALVNLVSSRQDLMVIPFLSYRRTDEANPASGVYGCISSRTVRPSRAPTSGRQSRMPGSWAGS